MCILTSITTFLSTSWAAPINHAYHAAKPKSNDTAVDKRQLQVLVDTAAIINAVQSVVTAIENVIDLVEGDIQDAESKYTTGIVSTLREQYPTMNVLVYHDQDSGYNLYGATHAHVEMDIFAGFSQGYEVWVFDYGTFELAGDGGYSNWAIGGNFDGPSSAVTFYSMNGN